MICHLIHQMNLNQYLYEKCSQMKIICFVCRRMHVHVKKQKIPPWLSSISKMVTISYLEQFRHSTVPLKVVSLFSKKYCVCSLMQLSLCGISDRPSSCSTAKKNKQSQFSYNELIYFPCFFELMLIQCLNNPCWKVNEPINF